MSQSADASAQLFDSDKIAILPGHADDYSACTFDIKDEDHTLGNALRWVVMKNPDVEFCGYSLPHPSESHFHIRIQMYSSLSAIDCLLKALGDLRDLLNSVNDKYGRSLASDEHEKIEDVDVRKEVEHALEQRRREQEMIMVE